MADPKTLPDIKTFLSDPKHANDKNFMFAAFDAYMEIRAEEAKKRALENPPEEPNIFDRLFGGAK